MIFCQVCFYLVKVYRVQCLVILRNELDVWVRNYCYMQQYTRFVYLVICSSFSRNCNFFHHFMSILCILYLVMWVAWRSFYSGALSWVHYTFSLLSLIMLYFWSRNCVTFLLPIFSFFCFQNFVIFFSDHFQFSPKTSSYSFPRLLQKNVTLFHVFKNTFVIRFKICICLFKHFHVFCIQNVSNVSNFVSFFQQQKKIFNCSYFFVINKNKQTIEFTLWSIYILKNG